MSYSAACRAYQRNKDKLLQLLLRIEKTGVNVDELRVLTASDNLIDLTVLLQRVKEIPLLSSLIAEAQHLKGSLENLIDEKREFDESNAYNQSDDTDAKLYGGISDDWEEYLDMIHHDK
jgi:hypothetical protein